MNTSIITSHELFEDDHPKYKQKISKYEKNVNSNVEFNDDEQEQSLFTKLKNIMSVSEVLRLLGACAVIASMSLFLLNGWAEGNDIHRYLKLLAQTGLLTVAGFALSFALKENKGARLFFALALISVVANFTILGSLTYSLFQLDGGLIDYPSMVTWTVVNASSFWPVFIAAVIALAVLARFSFSIFARGIASPLSVGFLTMNALLLIPVRSSLLVSIVALIAFGIASMLVKKLSQREKVVFTKETKFAFGLMFAPAFVIIARAVGLYSIDGVMMILLSGLMYAFLRFIVQRLNEGSLSAVVVRFIQFATCLVLSLSVISLLPTSMESLQALVFSILTLGLSLDQIQQTRSIKLKQFILNVTTVIIVGVNVILALTSKDMLIEILSVVTSIALFYIANRNTNAEQQNRFSKITAILGALISIGVLFIHIVELINMGNWMLIGIAGASFIVLGSLYERFGLSLTSIASPKSTAVLKPSYIEATGE